MNWLLASIFLSSIDVTGKRLFFMFPLCLSVAIVYKSTRCHSMRDVPMAALILWVTICLGMLGVGVGLWALFSILV